jgi:hypothetical protein
MPASPGIVVITVAGGAGRRRGTIIRTAMDAAIDAGDAHRRKRAADSRVRGID